MRRYPRPPAGSLFLRTTKGDWTRGEAAATATRWAEQLTRTLRPGETACVAIEDPAVLAMVLLAGLQARRSLAFLPASKDRALLDSQMQDAPGRTLISDDAALAPDLLFTPADRRDGTRDPLDLVTLGPTSAEGPFLSLRTSGTTGTPGWLRVHQVDAILVARAMNRMPHYRSGRHRLVFINPPLFHSMGMSTFLEYLHGGSAFALPTLGRAFFDFMKIGREVTTIEAVPDLYAGLVRMSANAAPALLHAGLGGDFPRKDDILRLGKDRSQPLTVSIRYGLTETPSAVAHNVFTLAEDADWTSSGRITPLYRVRIVTEDGTPCAPMAEGFIEVSGRHLAEDATTPPMGPGPRPIRTLRTQDLGFLDHDGRLHVAGRTKHFLKNRGFRISARAVENVFMQHEAVEECRVYHDGTHLILETVLRRQIEHAELLGSVATTLPAYSVPDRVEVVAAIAKTITGKIVRK